MENIQVKSRKRVADHGEVFTNEREVKAMLDLVSDQCNRLEATFLEPACGSGNFLIEILDRKLSVLYNRYKNSQQEYDFNLVVVVSSLYGIELLEDNAQECRERLYARIQKTYPKNFRNTADYPELMKSLQYVLRKNIICGDALSYKDKKGNPIVFTHWGFIRPDQVKQRYFDFKIIIHESRQLDLFSDSGQNVYIPQHNDQLPLTHYLKLYTYDNDQ